MGAWEWIPTGSFGRKCSIPTGSEFCTFSQTLAFPQNPRERLQRLSPHSQHWVVLSAFLPRGWRQRGGQSLRSPGTSPLAKPTAPSQLGFSFVAEGWGDGESPQCCLSHLTTVPGAAGSRRCLDCKGMFSAK